MRNLSDIERALRTKVGNDDALKLVHTRLFLRTGVNLRAIKPDQNADSGAVTKVITALSAFGYPLTEAR